MVLMWGKVRRLYLGAFRRGYVRRSHARRSGECARCGACCFLGHRCHSLRAKGNGNGHGTECAMHKFRPPNCRLFPIDERDMADRSLIAPDVPCGYSFEPEDSNES
jgi:hypothetical protein